MSQPKTKVSRYKDRHGRHIIKVETSSGGIKRSFVEIIPDAAIHNTEKLSEFIMDTIDRFWWSITGNPLNR